MSGAATDQQVAKRVYASLQAAGCPLVEDLHLHEADSMLQLLCSPSRLRTDILVWICCSINPNFASSKAKLVRSKDPDVVTKEVAVFGQELMLCRSDDFDLIRGDVSPRRQLGFLEQLLTLTQGHEKPAGHRLLSEIFADKNLPHLTRMLEPKLNPWPSHIRAFDKRTEPSYKPRRDEAADAAVAQAELEQLRSQCEFLNSETQSPAAFSPSALRVAACDLQQLMTTFSHVYETDLRADCSREPPSFSSETDVFQRVHQRLLACNTELAALKEVSEASASMSEDVKQLQTKPQYWSRGEKHTLLDQMEDMKK